MTCEYVVERAAAPLPSNTNQTLFSVSGGRVVVTAVFGEITENISGAGTTMFRVFGSGQGPSLGSGSTLNGVGSGNLFGGVGSPLIGLSVDAALGARVVQSGHTVRIVTEDTVSTGAMKYTLIYRPLDPGAKVEAV